MATATERIESELKWDRTTDVIIVGGGMAGHCAALDLVEAGVDVLLLEKQPEIGGSSVMSGGSFAFAGTDLQRRNGIEDTSELLFDDLRRVGGHQNDERLVRAYVDHQLATYEWFAAHRVRFEKLFLAAGQSVPRSHSRNPGEVLQIIAAQAEASRHFSKRVSAPALRLLRNGDGSVGGVLAGAPDSLRRLHARRGVLLASGGFSRSDRLLEIFAPVQVATQRTGGYGNTGDGLLMAWQLGAGMRDMGSIKGTFGGSPKAKPGEHSILLPIYVGAIAVNANGQRFIDESKSYKLIGDACLHQPGALGYQIFDQKIFERGQPGIPTMDFPAKFERGQIVTAPTLAALAAELGVDAAGLLKTIGDYNASVESSGVDPVFGRDGLSNHYGQLATISEPPFYGYPSTSTMLATYCGLSVNSTMNVCDAFDEPIRGLYAAGEVVGGLHGNAYMTGSAIGKASIFGRIAAASLLRVGG